MRFGNQLPEPLPGGHAHHEPINRYEEGVLHQLPLSALHATNHVVVHVQEISDDEREHRHIENRHREYRFNCWPDNRAQTEIQDGSQPHKRIDEYRQDFPPDNQLEGNDVWILQVRNKFMWSAHVDEIGLDIALDPTRTLAHPVPEATVCFFHRRGIEDHRVKPSFADTHTEIAILGHIEWVPTFQISQVFGPEMIGRPAERNRRLDRL